MLGERQNAYYAAARCIGIDDIVCECADGRAWEKNASTAFPFKRTFLFMSTAEIEKYDSTTKEWNENRNAFMKVESIISTVNRRH